MVLFQALVLALFVGISWPAKANNEDVIFTLHVGVGQNVAQLSVRRNENPVTVSKRFCSKTVPGALREACVSKIHSAVNRRLRWHKEDRRYALVEQHDYNVSYGGETGYTFSANSSDHIEAGLAHLRQNGYVVFRNVASPEEVKKARKLFWEFFSRFGSVKSDPRTWNNIPCNEYGIILNYGIGQSGALWYVRGLEKIHEIFASFWNTDELLVDFGGAVVFRPVRCTNAWHTAESWFHVDHNGLTRPGLQTVQGALSMTDQDQLSGGLVVIEKSHLFHDQFSARATSYWGSDPNSHFLLAPPFDSLVRNQSLRKVFVKARAGDLVLWDSRTLHCNTNNDAPKPRDPTSLSAVKPSDDATTTPRERSLNYLEKVKKLSSVKDEGFGGLTCPVEQDMDLQRLVALLSFSPRSFASSEILEQRRAAVNRGQTTTHWPHLFVADEGFPIEVPSLSTKQRDMIG